MPFTESGVSGKNVEDVSCYMPLRTGYRAGGSRSSRNQVTDKDQLQALLIGTTLRAYLWTLFGLAETYRSIGYFDLSLSRLQDLDYFLRFVQAGGRLITPSGRAPLCAYYKSDIGRNAREIRKCQSIIFDKYHSVINAYGPRFVANRHYKADLLAARFAISNESWPEAGKYLARAFAARPSRFVNDAVRKGGRAMVITVVAGAKEMLTPVFPPACGDRKYLRRGECWFSRPGFQRGVVSTVTIFLL